MKMNDNTLHASGMRASAGPAVETATFAAEASPSAVSWAAIFAGAAGAAVLSLILLILGTGLGLSSVSPFSGAGAETSGVSTIAWLTFTQLAASGIGGYLAGRLRTRWVSTHVDEVYFRDTAHGFLPWGVATLATAAMLSSVVGSIVGAGVKTAGVVAGGAATAARSDNAGGAGYFVDALFRPNAAAATAGATSARLMSAGESGGANAEAARIFASGLQAGALPANDVTYLGQTISQRTGMSQADAERRVNDTYASMKAKADQAKAQAREAADKAARPRRMPRSGCSSRGCWAPSWPASRPPSAAASATSSNPAIIWRIPCVPFFC